MGRINRWISTFEAYAMYLLTGAACLVVGSSLVQLSEHFSRDIAAIAALGSAFAVGRIATVFLTGYMAERFGAKKVLAAGVILLLAFMVGIPATHNYLAAILFSALGGIGMGTQDACCPIILREVFPRTYPSALSAGQAFFGAGCFLPPLLMGGFLSAGLPFYYTYYAFAAVVIVMLVLMPFMLPGKAVMAQEDTNEAAQQRAPGWGGQKKLLYVLFAVVCFSYCATTNTINLYTATYAQSLGIAQHISVQVLTAYNIGSMVGSMFFVGILRRVKPATVLWFNLSAALVCIGIAVAAKSILMLTAAYLAVGLFLGVLFSILVTLAIGLDPQRAGRAAAFIAMVGGGADMVSPLITGVLVMRAGIAYTQYYAVVMVIIALVFSWLFAFKHSEKNPFNYSLGRHKTK